jgi:hypothetical protein
MPFKKTKKGWESDPDGGARIPTRAGIFDRPIPPVRIFDGETGHEIGPDGKVNWKKIIEDANGKEGIE